MYRETHARSVAKSISWRVFATLTTALLVFVFTGSLAIAATVGGMQVLANMALCFLHERLWDRVRFGRRPVAPAVVWFTGLPSSGKTTLAQHVCAQLRERGLKVEFLDGDSVRAIFPQTGFARPDRDEHIRRVGYLASRLEENGIIVVASFVSPYRESRDFVRKLCRNFIEVHVSTPLEECERRDVKGLYARARRGEIKNFTGIDDPYEPPVSPEIEIDTRRHTVTQAGAAVLERLRSFF